MAWDPNRPAPWGRLSREWLIYAVVMIVAFVVFFRETVTGASVLGLAASYPLYLGFGAVLAKFGYQRKTFRDLRRESIRPRNADTSDSGGSPSARRRPAPTSRTSTGPSQHRPSGSRKKKRR